MIFKVLKVFKINYGNFLQRTISTRIQNKLISHPFLQNFNDHSNNIGIVDNLAKYKYSDMLKYSHYIAKKMNEKSPSLTSEGRSNRTICFLCPNDASYVSVLLACWVNGNIAVPLCKEHPSALHEYFLKDSRTSLIVCTSPFLNQMQPLSEKLNIPLLKIQHPTDINPTEFTNVNKHYNVSGDDGAVIIYTSGTTGPPKGVLLTHNNIYVQVHDIVKAWEWNSSTAMLNVLPLHHVHGFLYCLLSPLAVGGTVIMVPKFDPVEVWKFFVGLKDNTNINTFSAVPTVYTKLINKYEEFLELTHLKPNDVKEKCVKNISLMASGSSALPDTVFHTWQHLTGHTILERYGMSEIGMALSNPLIGKRIAGSVGTAVPEVQVRIAKLLGESLNENFEILAESRNGKTSFKEKPEPGDLHIKGPNVFKEYWMKPEATIDTFTNDGWFKTGDVSIYEDGVYRILGRASSDIIKTGGYKVSALDIERFLLEHEAIAECTVFGIPDAEWGEKIVALYGVHIKKQTSTSELKEFLKTKLPPYSIPKIFKCVDDIPRNVTGKVNKKELKQQFLKEL